MSPAERLARSFHAHYERLAPRFGNATRPNSAVPWDQLPEQNRELMIETAAAVITDLELGTALGYQAIRPSLQPPTGRTP